MTGRRVQLKEHPAGLVCASSKSPGLLYVDVGRGDANGGGHGTKMIPAFRRRPGVVEIADDMDMGGDRHEMQRHPVEFLMCGVYVGFLLFHLTVPLGYFTRSSRSNRKKAILGYILDKVDIQC